MTCVGIPPCDGTQPTDDLIRVSLGDLHGGVVCAATALPAHKPGTEHPPPKMA